MEAKYPQTDEHLSELALPSDQGSSASLKTQTKPRNLSNVAWIFVFVSLISSMFLFALDNTIVANVQPSIIESLGHVDMLPWVSVSYPLGVVALNLLQTNLFMIFDNKPLFITSVVLFEIGSAICGSAPNMSALIVGRFVCGLGGCGIYVGAMNLVSALTSEAERSMYLGLAGLTWGIGTVLGPVIGGAFAGSSATWRWCFYVNLCVGLVVAPVYLFLLPSHLPCAKSGIFDRLRHIDWIGAMINAGAMASLIMGISFGGGVYAWSSPSIIALFVVSGTLWFAFIAQQYFALFTTNERRLFPAKYLHSKEMVILFLQILAASCVVYIPLYYIPLYFQFVRGDTSLQTAVRLLPLVFSQVVGVIMSGALLNQVGYYFPWYLAGGSFSLVGGVLLYLVNLDTNTGAIYGYSVLVGLGSGLYVQIGYAICQLLVPAAEIPHTVAFIGYGHITGITLSLTLGGSIFLNTATNAVQHILPGMPRAMVQKGITGTSGHFFSTLPPADRLPILSAIVESISDLYMIVIVAASFSIFMSLAMKRQRLVTVQTK